MSSTPQRPARRRSTLRRLAILAVQAAFVIALLELALRGLEPADVGLRGLLHRATMPSDLSRVASLPELMSHTFLGYRPYEELDGFVLNSRSLRTHEYSTLKPPGTFRVIALGDSLTFGGVPDAAHWTERLEAGLAAARAQPVEVLRFGVPATGPAFQLRLWELEGSRLAADAVVQAFFVGNDFFDEGPEVVAGARLSDRLAAASYTFAAVRNLLRLRRDVEATALPRPTRSAPRPERSGTEVPGFDHRETAPSFSASAHLRIESERATLCRRDQELRFAVRLDRVLRLIERLAFEVRRSGATFTVLLLPDEYQVDPELLARVAQHTGRTVAAYDVGLPQRRLVAALTARNIAVVDLLPAFRAAHEDGLALYRPRDTHFSRAGHELAADRLLAALAH